MLNLDKVSNVLNTRTIKGDVINKNIELYNKTVIEMFFNINSRDHALYFATN